MIQITSSKGTCGTIVCNLLTELGCEFNVKNIALDHDKSISETPISGRVPILEIGNIRISQTLTICLYICEKYDFCGRMLSLDSEARYKQIESLCVLATDIQPIIRFVFRQEIHSKIDFSISIKQAVDYIRKLLYASGSNWLFDSNYSLNDIYAFELMRWVSNTEYNTLLTPIIPWLENCLKIQSIETSIRQDGLKFWGKPSAGLII